MGGGRELRICNKDGAPRQIPNSRLPPTPTLPRKGGGSESAVRPHRTVLIAALGGEGGGVLTNWIVTAAEES